MALISLGLSQIEFGTAAPGGTMPSTSKIGKTYKDSCKLAQATSDVTEHYQEGYSAPEVRKKFRKLPILTFSIMDPDAQFLADYVGGTITTNVFGMDGTEVALDRAIRVKTVQGLWIDIPNADIDAVVNAEFSTKGIFLVDFTVTPKAVTSGKPIQMYDGTTGLTVTPTTLSFTSAADSTGKTITATSTGNLTYAGAPSTADWITVTRTGKVATVKVTLNANTETRTAIVTLQADGLSAYVLVSQTGS